MSHMDWRVLPACCPGTNLDTMAATSMQTTVESLTLEDECYVLKGSDVIEVFGLKCERCEELFNLKTKAPKLLPCSHTVCGVCISSMIETQNKPTLVPVPSNVRETDTGPTRQTTQYFSDTTFSQHMPQNVRATASTQKQNVAVHAPLSKCPQCLATFDATKPLLNDHRVVKGLDIIGKAKETYKNVCLKHDCSKLIRLCKTCEVPVCLECIRFSHTGKEHVIVELKKSLENMAASFDDLEAKCLTSLEQGKMQIKILKNIKHRLDINEKLQIGKVEDKFDQYNKMLTERKDVLITMIKDRKSKYLSELNLEVQQLEDSTTELNKLYKEFSTSRESEAVREIFQLQRRLSESDLLKKSSNENLCKTFEFQAVDNDRLESVLAVIGDVQEKCDLKMQCPAPENSDGSSHDVFQFSAT